jgi:predicted O-linked N-acetylglucosamine transferase (SPINDLY family)
MNRSQSNKPEGLCVLERVNSEGAPSRILAAVRSAVASGRLEEAAGLLDDRAMRAVWAMVEQNPGRADLVCDLAMILLKIGRKSEVEECCKKLLDSAPSAAVYNKLGCLCQCMGRMSEALKYQQKAVEARPDRPELWANLARVLMETRDMQEGIELLKKAIEKMPDNAPAHSNFLLRLHQMPELDPHKLFEEHKRWGRVHAPASLARTNHQNIPDPDRRLRVGYVSPDFRRHSVAYFFESLLDGHDRQDVEVYGYGNVEFPDQLTERLMGKFDNYRNLCDLSDEAAAESVAQDRIDILVDLAGHSADNRLLVLARKPAPVQVTYLGYPGTTGMEAVDYRLTDVRADPPELQQFYTEELVFLPDGFLCYRPPDFAPLVAPLPADQVGYITFGSFNNNCKINPVVTRLWAEVLKANVNSRLLLKLKGGDEPLIRDRYLGEFEKAGLSRARVEVCGWKSPAEHLQTYGRVDIALDTYPYNGTTTTCEALWMGVPTVSLVGKCHASRVGLSILTCLGLEFFAASSPKEYVARATALAANRPALAQIRSSMRARIATSGLCYAKGFADQVETAYRQMWRRWCQARSHNLTPELTRSGGLARPSIGGQVEQQV